jgi:hypothetical protein
MSTDRAGATAQQNEAATKSGTFYKPFAVAFYFHTTRTDPCCSFVHTATIN